MAEAVTTYYLEMTSPSDLKDKPDSKGLNVIEAEIDEFRLNKFLYEYVGGPWQWKDKLSLPDSAWAEYVSNPNLRTWVAYFKGAIAGYFELHAEDDGNTEIMYFGLAEAFIGKGFGGYLLSQAIQSAWSIPSTKRVWVHTCNLDHESALNNYRARGFTLCKTESDT
ncbi:GNAT family N-acetyltransferase [Veronia pacifica]|uniref:GCN5 family acetyltransferase n=1 Tax=Veronia pacifica TaxID=1080227 RepID=A0A1C3ESP1_9GAMM|nr:GNAT family N-acetyltransferase [Veronia pacifica]ODA36271.1 GCN5 family acetyltransferase [Veronia pacifica]